MNREGMLEFLIQKYKENIGNGMRGDYVWTGPIASFKYHKSQDTQYVVCVWYGGEDNVEIGFTEDRHVTKDAFTELFQKYSSMPERWNDFLTIVTCLMEVTWTNDAGK